jgi:replicative DNA helicase
MESKKASQRTWDKVLRSNARRLRLDAARQASGERVLSHVPTGFEKLDSEYGGLRIGVVTELLAHTGDGKSAFIRQATEGAARAGVGALVIYGEDPEDATAERQLAADTGLNTAAVGRLDLQGPELDNIDRAVDRAVGWAGRVLPNFESHDVDSVLELIDATATVGIGNDSLKLVAIDYAQVLGTSRNLEDDIARLGEELHARARERKFAVLIGSQVSNDVVKRGREGWFSKRDISQIRPSLGDTEWCKRLEKYSKAVWALIRPGRWQREWGEDVADDVAELHVVKANFGGMGYIELGWDGPTTRFSNR